MATPESETIVNGMAIKPFEELVGEVREQYLNTISDAMDEALAKFILPWDRVSLLMDAGPFLCFLISLKLAEVQTPVGATMDKKDPLRAWWKLGKEIDKAVAPMLLEYGREAAARQMQGASNAS